MDEQRTESEQLQQKMKAVRQYYGLSRRAMSRVCGFGDNTWRLYENGTATPQRVNLTLIRMVFRPSAMKILLRISDPTQITGWEAAIKKADRAINEIDELLGDCRNQMIEKFATALLNDINRGNQ